MPLGKCRSGAEVQYALPRFTCPRFAVHRNMQHSVCVHSKPMEPWQTEKHQAYHKLYEERIFPPMFWNYAWVNWMPKTQGWWAGNRKLQLTTSLPYGSFYRPIPWY
ncbi:hypothetical protein M514_11141 [Trichuris suis]|uniref:Uncharacterized protein n=1 Tax=Trichuris suis TaxID=68888 RepID=A0A085LSL8_9BILA|nr:hypothetical protein M513_11141 [Trichuris suis]KFD65730.1 hypothetical protein M514_11141 [Trichuris suis]